MCEQGLEAFLAMGRELNSQLSAVDVPTEDAFRGLERCVPFQDFGLRNHLMPVRVRGVLKDRMYMV